MLRSLLASVLFAAAPVAQGDGTTFVPEAHLGRWQLENLPALLAHLPATRLGELHADEEVATAVATAVARQRAHTARRRALVAAARTRKVELDPWIVATLYRNDPTEALHDIALEDVLRAELVALSPREGAMVPDTVAILGCLPRAEGRWTRLLEDHAQQLEADAGWLRDPDARFEGLPLHAFRAARELDEQQAQRSGLDLPRTWLLHLPGAFVIGSGLAEHAGRLAPPPPRPEPGIHAELDLEAYVAMFRRFGAPAELTTIGLDTLKALRWRLRFAGPLVLDELELEAGGAPSGVVGALLSGKGEPPAQAMPGGALAQVRGSIDVAGLLDAIQQLVGGRELPADIAGALRAAFPGGVAVGVGAPAPGGVLPRVFVSLAVADREALTKVIDAIARKRMPRTEVTYEGVPCTVLTLEEVPQGLQPAWCVVDGVLHVAESGASLRALLKARAGGAAAMDVGDAPLPEGPGDAVAGFEVRYDAGALYRAFHRHWLPLLKLIPGAGLERALLQADEMPEPDAVVPLLGTGRGVLRRAGDTWTLQQLGTVGGLHTVALAIAWGPLLSAAAREDWAERQLEFAVASAQLAVAWTALEAFREQHQRWPRDLGELFTAGKLPDDALLLPGDDAAETVSLPGGRTGKTSFRYFAEPARVDVDGQQHALLLVAIAPARTHRAMLADDGAVPQAWGDVNQKAIEQFGK